MLSRLNVQLGWREILGDLARGIAGRPHDAGQGRGREARPPSITDPPSSVRSAAKTRRA